MQSKKHSILEQVANVGSGVITAALTWEYIIRPLIKNGHLTIDDTMPITLTFTAISIVRGYFWRRLFNWVTINKITFTSIWENFLVIAGKRY